MKLIHVRFVKRDEDEMYSEMKDAQAVQPRANRFRKINVAKSPAKSLSSVHVKPKASPVKSQCYPKSLSVLEMLKMGKVLNNKRTTVITLHSFNIELMAWNLVPTTVEFDNIFYNNSHEEL